MDRLASCGMETTVHQVHIRQRAGHQQAMGVLGRASVANLDNANDPFDNPDDMLHFGPNSGFGPILCPLDPVHDPLVSNAAVREILRLRRDTTEHGGLAVISPIPPTSVSRSRKRAGNMGLSAPWATVAATE